MHARKKIGAVFRHICARPWDIIRLPLLYVLRHRDVRYRAPSKRRFDRFIDDVVHVGRTHDPLVERGDVHEELVEIDILLVVHADQVVESMSRNCEHGLAIALRVIQTVQQMNASGPGCRQADA